MTPDEDQLILIGRKAHQVASRWPDVSAQDLRQELIIRWIEMATAKEKTGAVSWDDYFYDEDQKRGEAKLNKALTRCANKWCRRETAAIRGNDDYHQYTRYQLLQMLPSLNEPDEWGSLAVTGAGGRSGKLACEGGDSLAVYADLTRAYDMLSDEDQWLIQLRYVDQAANWQQIAVMELACTAEAARKRTSRALDHMEILLAGQPFRSGPLVGRRMAISNASAQSRLRSEYDG